jgi:hypothetical protein
MITPPSLHSRVIFTVLLLFLAAFGYGQNTSLVKNAKVPTGTGGQTQTTNPNSTAPAQILKVTINSSRISVTRDGSYGVFADLENVSSDIVTVYPQETMLVVRLVCCRPANEGGGLYRYERSERSNAGT